MRAILSLWIVLYRFASFSFSQNPGEIHEVTVTINAPPNLCINILTLDSDTPKRCCGVGVKPPRRTADWQIVPSFVNIKISSKPGNDGYPYNRVYLEGDFNPKVTSLDSTPGCISWYDLGEFKTQKFSFDESYRLINENHDVIGTGCGARNDFTFLSDSTNPYWIPSRNPLQRALERLDTPSDIKDYDEPSGPGLNFSLTLGSNTNPIIPALNQINALNPEIPVTQGSLLIPDIMPVKEASTINWDISSAGSDCMGDGCNGLLSPLPKFD